MTNSKEFPSHDQFLFLFSWRDGGLDGTGKALPGKIFFPETFDGEILAEVIFVLISFANLFEYLEIHCDKILGCSSLRQQRPFIITEPVWLRATEDNK